RPLLEPRIAPGGHHRFSLTPVEAVRYQDLDQLTIRRHPRFASRVRLERDALIRGVLHDVGDGAAAILKEDEVADRSVRGTPRLGSPVCVERRGQRRRELPHATIKEEALLLRSDAKR